MSNGDSKRLVRQFVVSVNSGNADGLGAIIAEDYIQHNPQAGPGLDGVKQFFTMMFAAFPDLRLTAEDIVAEGDRVVLRWTMTGTHQGDFLGIPPTGRQISISGMDIWRIADGKFAEHWDALDNLGMLQQLGVIPTG